MHTNVEILRLMQIFYDKKSVFYWEDGVSYKSSQTKGVAMAGKTNYLNEAVEEILRLEGFQSGGLTVYSLQVLNKLVYVAYHGSPLINKRWVYRLVFLTIILSG